MAKNETSTTRYGVNVAKKGLEILDYEFDG